MEQKEKTGKTGTMKIAQVAPLYEAVPPKLYGGTERIVAYLSDALVELGHDVTLFASAEARTKARLVAVRDQAIRLDPCPLHSDAAAHLVMLHEVRRRAAEFDVIHFHIDPSHLPLFEAMAERTVTTMHGRLDLKDLPELYRCWPQFPMVSISDHQRGPLPQANWLGTVYHGIPTHLLQPGFAPGGCPGGGYLAFLGRISPEKRPDRAIEIAKLAGVPLKIAAKVDKADRAYFHDYIEPLLDHPLVEWIGEIGDGEKSRFLSAAAALVFPIDWPEPFGLVLIEAMACGTPVVAWGCGSVPEVIDDGVTGFIVHSMEEAVDAVGRVESLDRRRIRSVFERRFSAPVMAGNYARHYWQLLTGELMRETA
jgi:glycosyltransferase involved in cell wall biosynthesis